MLSVVVAGILLPRIPAVFLQEGRKSRMTRIGEVTYEGYGPGGAAVIVSCVGDSRERTGADVRAAFAGHGGHLGARGSVSYLFNEVGVLSFPAGAGEDRVTVAALAACAEDVLTAKDGSIEVLTDPRDLASIAANLGAAGLVAQSVAVTRRSSVSAPVAGEDVARMRDLLATLEDLDGVEGVWTNASFPADALSGAASRH
jgi:transcriptional/translational regulatory protein YebC/TACO1